MQYDRNKKKAKRLSGKLRTQRFERAIREFHSSVHAEKIDRQLNGIKPLHVV